MESARVHEGVRGSDCFFTPKAGKKVSKSQLTRVGRALKQPGTGIDPTR